MSLILTYLLMNEVPKAPMAGTRLKFLFCTFLRLFCMAATEV